MSHIALHRFSFQLISRSELFPLQACPNPLFCRDLTQRLPQEHLFQPMLKAQIHRGANKMKIKLLIAACCYLGIVVTTPAQVGGVKVKIPFEFEIAKETLPPGEYVIWSERDQVFLRIAGGRTVAMVQSNRTVHDGGKTGKVVFNCYEKHCFLSQLWTSDPDQARQLPKSKSEVEMAQQAEPQQFALLGTPLR